MSTSIKFASTPTADTPGTCLYVHSDKRSYVFGRIPEGTQRAFNTNRISMGSTEQVFLSGSTSWNQIGGLFGFALTVSNAVESSREQLIETNNDRKQKGLKPLEVTLHGSMDVHGGDNLCHILASMRSIIMRQAIYLSPSEHRDDPRATDLSNLEPDWQDDCLRVWKIPVHRSRSSSPQKRRFASHDEGESMEQDVFKPLEGSSDPTLAKTIVEKSMFNKAIGAREPLLFPKKLSLVQSSDLVFTRKDRILVPYHGPFSDSAVELDDPDKTVWVLQSGADSSKPTEKPINLKYMPLPRATYSQTSMSYIVKCQDRRGKFNPVAAKGYGVPPHQFKLLTMGMSVEGKDGVTVTPDMVLGEPLVGKGFVVADIESRDFLDSFLERPEWSNAELMKDILAMYWNLGPGMTTDVRIHRFVQDHPEFKHVFTAPDACPNMIALSGPAELQTRLHRIDPERFSLLKYDNRVRGAPIDLPQIELGRTGNLGQIAPRPDLKTRPNSFPDLLEAAQAIDQDVIDIANKAKLESSDPEFLQKIEEEEIDIPNRDAEIIPLGTGSSIPGKYRNVSATLIRVPGHGNFLLDCGEGTLGQIQRLFGEEETTAILRDLKCIAISHLHADHHLGTPSIAKAWYESTLENSDAKLAISCIWRYKTMLEEASQIEDFGFHRLHFVNCTTPKERAFVTAEQMGNEFGLASIKRVPVPHCWRSDAVQLELTSGLRIAYSGDCRPSDDFARECEGAHLLVHECTFDDDMGSHAEKKQHSTMSEALGVAKNMKARRTLLTHFSQRYVKSDSLQRDGLGSGEVLMAFDHMRVRLGDFKKAALFQPAIAKMLEVVSDK